MSSRSAILKKKEEEAPALASPQTVLENVHPDTVAIDTVTPHPAIISETITEVAQLSDSVTTQITNVLFTQSPAGAFLSEIPAPEEYTPEKYYQALRWPILLKPKLNETCFDTKSQTQTVPVQILNVTALFEVVIEDDIEIDEYLTITYLTCLDTYYKLFDFPFDSYRFKNQFLNDMLKYLLTFNKKTDLEENIQNVLNHISFSNKDEIRFAFICSNRIYKQLPKPRLPVIEPKMEVFLNYDTPQLCSVNGFVSYRVGTSLYTDLPPEIYETLKDFLVSANRRRMFNDVNWEVVKTRQEVVMLIIERLQKENIVGEYQAQVIDYLTKFLRNDLSKGLPPIVEKECISRVSSPVAFAIASDHTCSVEGYTNNFNTAYYIDVIPLMKTLKRVEKPWIEKLVPLLTNPSTVQKLNMTPDFDKKTKGIFFRDLLLKLESVSKEDPGLTTMLHAMINEIDMTGYGSTPLQCTSNCPGAEESSPNSRFIDKWNFQPCNLMEIPTAISGKFINITKLFAAFFKNASKHQLYLLAKVLKHNGIHSVLPELESGITNVKFLEKCLNRLKTNLTGIAQSFLLGLLSQLNRKVHDTLDIEHMCSNSINTNGEYLRYPTEDACESWNIDFDVSKLASSFDPDTSQNQISTLASLILTKDAKFYAALSSTDPNKFNKSGEFLKAVIEAYMPNAGKEDRVLFEGLLPHILMESSPPLSIITECSNEPVDLSQLLNSDDVKKAMEKPHETGLQDIAARIFTPEASGRREASEEELKYKETAVIGQRKIKEWLYAVFGDDPEYSEALNILEKTNIYTDKMYEGFSVVDELPDPYKLALLLRRYYQAVEKTGDEDVIESVEMVLNGLQVNKPINKRETENPTSFDLKTMLQEIYPQAPEEVRQAGENLSVSMNLQNVVVDSPYNEVVPYLVQMEILQQIPVLLKMLFETHNLSKIDLKKIVTLHNFFDPNNEDFIDTETQYQKMLFLLKAYTKNITDEETLKSRDVIAEFLQNEKDTDRGIQKLATLKLRPKEFLIRGLRRYREIMNKKSHYHSDKLWVATTNFLKFLQVPDHDLTENEIDEDLDVVNFFRPLEEDEKLIRSKGVVLKYIITNMKNLSDVFAGLNELENFADEEKLSIVINRLARIASDITPHEKEALEIIAKHVESLGYDNEERDYENQELKQTINLVLQNSTSKRDQLARAYLLKAVNEHPEIFDDVIRGLVISDYDTPEQQLTIVLRGLMSKYRLKLGANLLWAINVTFERLNINIEDSSEDQFVGDFTPHLTMIVRESLPKNLTPELEVAFNSISQILKSRKTEVKNLLKGIHLYKHSRELQSRIIILHSKELKELSDAEIKSIDLIWDYLDFTTNEILGETINESEKISAIFDRVLKNVDTPVELIKAKGVVMHYLSSGKKYLKLAFKGIRYGSTDLNILEQIFNNIVKNNNQFDDDIIGAITKISEYLDINVAYSALKKVDLAQKIISSFERIFKNTKGYTRDALENFSAYARNYPASFENIMASIVTDGNDQETVSQALKAIQNYGMPLSGKFRSAAALLQQTLEKEGYYETNEKKVKRRKSREEQPDKRREVDEIAFEKVKRATLRLLYLENHGRLI